MTDRRRSDRFLQSGSPAYLALRKAIDDSADRAEAIYERIEGRLDRMDRDISRTEKSQALLSSEVAEMRRDVGELRDATHLAANRAVAGANDAASKVTKRQMRWWEILGLVFGTFVALVAFYKNIGVAMKDVTLWWRWVIDESPTAHVRPKDETHGPA